jgi:hypothetical protein
MKQTLNSVVIFRDGSGRCSSRAVAMRLDSPQPRFNLGCGWGHGSLTSARIVVASVVVGGTVGGLGERPGRASGDTVSPEWQSRVGVSPPRRRVFARGPVCLSTDQARHPRFASRTDFAGQSGGSSGKAGLEPEIVALPQGAPVFALGPAVWRDSLRRTPPWQWRFAVRRRSR